MNRAVKYNESYLNEVSVTPLYSSSTFISARHKAGEKMHIYGPESQVKQEKEDVEEEEGETYLYSVVRCCVTSLRPYMYHKKKTPMLGSEYKRAY